MHVRPKQIHGARFVDEFLSVIHQRMDDLGWTRYRLAQEAKISQTHVHRIMNGEQVPSVEVADKLAKALGLQLKLVSR
jgi:ribosome-binding protein aMBF1 (putative translation factor)